MFIDTLDIELALKPKSGNAVSIVGGNIKDWELDLHNWGFRARVAFLVSLEKKDDPVFEFFTSPEQLEVELKIKPHLVPQGQRVEPLAVRGLSTVKAILAERINAHAGKGNTPLLHRLYEVEWLDPAQALWRWHRPFDLMVDKSVKELLLAHKSDKVELQCDWELLEQTWPVLCLPLGLERGGASFHDFVLWYVQTRDGVFSYNPATGGYTLAAEKENEGQAAALDRRWVESLRIEFPEPPRHEVRILNADAENPQQQQIDNPHAVEGLYKDYLDRFPLAERFDQRQQLERGRLFSREHELLLVFREYPPMTYSTASLISLAGDLWGDTLFSHEKEYRVRAIHIKAQAVDEAISSDYNQPFNRFNLEMRSRLELREEKFVALPPVVQPLYPVLVEGWVVSEQGEEAAQTYQLYEESETSRSQYKIQIPLWDNQVVVAPFDPALHSGHFYFPGYKRARALVALDFQSVQIVQWLDWHDEARLPADTQGNRILMGWTPESRTAISHTYINNLPVFAVERLADKDTESITMSDGSLVIQTMEKKE